MTWFNPNNPPDRRRSIDRRNIRPGRGRTYPEAEALEWFNALPMAEVYGLTDAQLEPVYSALGKELRHSFRRAVPRRVAGAETTSTECVDI
ncbi:MAG: hypothetical protein R2857_14450 [Vampirovibrionales bacterium]